MSNAFPASPVYGGGGPRPAEGVVEGASAALHAIFNPDIKAGQIAAQESD